MSVVTDELQASLAGVLREIHGEHTQSVFTEVGFLSPNTQARRLGCCLFLLGKVIGGARTERLLESLPKEEVEALAANLRKNQLNSGFITKTKWSVRHYVELLKDLRLLASQGTVYLPTGTTALLFKINQIDWRAPYPLTPEVKRFWFRFLLEKDAIGISALLRILLAGKTGTIQECIARYPDVLMDTFRELEKTAGATTLRVKLRAKIIEMGSWRNPQKYAEHLVPPRINWLIDLGLIQADEKECCFIAPEFLLVAQALANDLSLNPLKADLITLVFGQRSGLIEIGSSVFLEEAINLAFSSVGKSGGLQKLRLADLLTYLVCNRPEVLLGLARDKKGFVDSLSASTEFSYQLYNAQRATQSYLYRKCR